MRHLKTETRRVLTSILDVIAANVQLIGPIRSLVCLNAADELHVPVDEICRPRSLPYWGAVGILQD
jgi:hypothetical protein